MVSGWTRRRQGEEAMSRRRRRRSSSEMQSIEEKGPKGTKNKGQGEKNKQGRIDRRSKEEKTKTKSKKRTNEQMASLSATPREIHLKQQHSNKGLDIYMNPSRDLAQPDRGSELPPVSFDVVADEIASSSYSKHTGRADVCSSPDPRNERAGCV